MSHKLKALLTIGAMALSIGAQANSGESNMTMSVDAHDEIIIEDTSDDELDALIDNAFNDYFDTEYKRLVVLGADSAAFEQLADMRKSLEAEKNDPKVKANFRAKLRKVVGNVAGEAGQFLEASVAYSSAVVTNVVMAPIHLTFNFAKSLLTGKRAPKNRAKLTNSVELRDKSAEVSNAVALGATTAGSTVVVLAIPVAGQLAGLSSLFVGSLVESNCSGNNPRGWCHEIITMNTVVQGSARNIGANLGAGIHNKGEAVVEVIGDGLEAGYKGVRWTVNRAGDGLSWTWDRVEDVGHGVKVVAIKSKNAAVYVGRKTASGANWVYQKGVVGPARLANKAGGKAVHYGAKGYRGVEAGVRGTGRAIRRVFGGAKKTYRAAVKEDSPEQKAKLKSMDETK